MTVDHNAIQCLAKKIRIHATRMIHTAKSSHLGGNLSMAEILAVLYGRVLNIVPFEPTAGNRDRLVLSKGHAAASYYAVLAECGFFPVEWLDEFYINGGRLAGHTTHNIPGIEVSSGSLGHGLSIAVGMALAGMRDNANYRVFTILSDGDCDEGSTWEAAMFAAHHNLENLIAIVDYNKLQALGYTKHIVDLEPLADKWLSFGWGVHSIDGHEIKQILSAMETLPLVSNQPSCIIAHTIKGKGISFMEDDVLWHYRNPQGEEYRKALEELGVSK
jgi:transketolase